jgi:arabinan endo-1,5-alpha-L-arabinosidase
MITSFVFFFSLVLNHDFPDPAILRANDGYYAYATQGFSETATHGPALTRPYNIQIARSPNGIVWSHLGDALPVKPAWANRTQKFWAPHVSEVDGKYAMYFSAEPNPNNLDRKESGLCIGVAFSEKPEGPFAPMAAPLKCGDGFQNIDPMFFHDPLSTKNYLVWGSGFGPLRIRELASDLKSFAKSAETPILKPNSQFEYLGLVEAAWVDYRDGYYYLFFAGNNCCNPNPHYAVLVARSTRLEGPYELMNATGSKPGVLLESFDRFLAPGHNSVIDIDGQSFMYFHAIDSLDPILKKVIPGDRDVRRIMLRAEIFWRDGWPSLTP